MCHDVVYLGLYKHVAMTAALIRTITILFRKSDGSTVFNTSGSGVCECAKVMYVVFITTVMLGIRIYCVV